MKHDRVLDLAIQKLSTKILGCLPPHIQHDIKVNRYDNRGKYLELRKKSVDQKK